MIFTVNEWIKKVRYVDGLHEYKCSILIAIFKVNITKINIFFQGKKILILQQLIDVLKIVILIH